MKRKLTEEIGLDIVVWPEVRSANWCNHQARQVLRRAGIAANKQAVVDAVSFALWKASDFAEANTLVNAALRDLGLLAKEKASKPKQQRQHPLAGITTRKTLHVGFVTVYESPEHESALRNAAGEALRLILKQIYPRYGENYSNAETAIDDSKNGQSRMCQYTEQHFGLADQLRNAEADWKLGDAALASGKRKVAAWDRMDRQRKITPCPPPHA